MYLVLLVRVGLLSLKTHYQLFLYSGLGRAGCVGEPDMPAVAAAVHSGFQQASATFPVRTLKLSH